MEKHTFNIRRLELKLIRAEQKTKNLAASIFEAEVHDLARATVALGRLQLKIRPRLRLISKAIPALTLIFLASSTAVAYIKPREAEIKIAGQAILVARDKPAAGEGTPEITQTIGALRSPFLYEKPIDGQISQGYRSYHRALDITSPLGTPIKPVGPGVVEFAGFVPDGKGNIVIVDHGDDLKTLYAHMGKIYVGVGNAVDTNDTLGTVGLTGRTTGPHVHFEVYDRETLVNPGNLIP